MDGLLSAKTKELQTLVEAIQNGTLRLPLTSAKLRAAGIGALSAHLPLLEGLQAAQVLTFVRCVLAERQQQRGPRLELVWTGPDVQQTVVRDTAIVVRDLFAHAQSSVLIGGCYFSQGEEILKPLACAIKERGVRATFCMNIPEAAPTYEGVDLHVRRQVRAFIAQNWPFGPPLPAFYYDPRTVVPGARVLLHSKCVVVDERTAFITSANFTHNGQERNIETGVQIEDEKFARALSGHWHGLIRAGLLRSVDVRHEDIRGGALDGVIEQWNQLRDLVDAEYLPLFDQLKARGLPVPNDAGVELTWQGRVTGEQALLCWEVPIPDGLMTARDPAAKQTTGSPRVGLVRATTRADDVDTVVATPDADPDLLAQALRERLGIRS